MKKEYYIIGSGGFAKEVYFLAQETLDATHNFMGFIDLKPSASVIEARGEIINVLDEDYFLQNISSSQNIDLYMGIGDPKLMHKLSIRFSKYSFPNLIHPNFIGDKKSIKMGSGNIITAGCIFTVDITIGSYNIFNLSTTVGHDTVIENCNVFNPGVNISGSVKIGSKNLFGTNSTVLQMLQINDENILGAASLATKHIDSNCVMVGVPAKKLER